MRAFAAFLAFVLATSVSLAGAAMAQMPNPTYLEVKRLGFLCTVDADRGQKPGLSAAELCRAAVEETSRALRARPDIEVVALSDNDQRIGDPDTLVVIVQGRSRRAARIIEGALGELMTLQVGLFRALPGWLGASLFPAHPELVHVAPGASAAKAAAARLPDLLRPTVIEPFAPAPTGPRPTGPQP
ncbi:MAG: hypothetical protein ACT4P2_14295 [Pseudomonadota bacterium]